MNERATGATVAVSERVDRLELRVHQRCLHDCRKLVFVDELAEVLQVLDQYFDGLPDAATDERV